MMKKTHKINERSVLTEEGLEKELNDINLQLNRFLKNHFTIEIESLQVYLHNVKDLLIKLTTKNVSPIVSNVFSKFSNILQPFTSYSYDLSLDALKNQINSLEENKKKMEKKMRRMFNELEDLKIKSNKSMEFIYMLRINNINVDELFKRSVELRKQAAGQKQREDGQSLQLVDNRRKGMEFDLKQEEYLLNMLVEDQSKLNSQYASLKSRR